MSHTIPRVRPHSPLWYFEENYRQLKQLLPELAEADEELLLCAEGHHDLHIRIDERCRYTTMLTLRKHFSVEGEALPDLAMRLRVYDDARVVEVSAYQGCERIPARYQVGEGVRYQRDEKLQANKLLFELLRHCLRHGFSPCVNTPA